MKIVFLDAKTIGDDIDLSAFEKLGEVVTYNFSTTEEALERTVDAFDWKSKKTETCLCDGNGNKQSG